MKGDPIPGEDHISRYCSRMHLTEDGEVTGTAFMLRPNDEYLSVNWREFLNLPEREDQIRQVRRLLSLTLKLRKTARIAVLNVGEIIDYVRAQTPDSRILSVLHDPEEADPSHSGVYGYGLEDPLIADLIKELILETYPAREPT